VVIFLVWDLPCCWRWAWGGTGIAGLDGPSSAQGRHSQRGGYGKWQGAGACCSNPPSLCAHHFYGNIGVMNKENEKWVRARQVGIKKRARDARIELVNKESDRLPGNHISRSRSTKAPGHTEVSKIKHLEPKRPLEGLKLSGTEEEEKEKLKQAWTALRETGLSINDCAAIFRLSRRACYWMESSREITWAQSNLQIAQDSVLLFAQGIAVNGVEPKPGDIQKACDSIMDRADPIVAKSEVLKRSLSVSLSDDQAESLSLMMRRHYKKEESLAKAAQMEKNGAQVDLEYTPPTEFPPVEAPPVEVEGF